MAQALACNGTHYKPRDRWSCGRHEEEAEIFAAAGKLFLRETVVDSDSPFSVFVVLSSKSHFFSFPKPTNILPFVLRYNRCCCKV